LNCDFLVLYPIPPKTLARYREAFASRGAKSDPNDADRLLKLGRTHADRLRAWPPDDALTRQRVCGSSIGVRRRPTARA